MKIKLTKIAAAGLGIVVAGGCATQTPTEAEFGDSVRAATTGQIHDMNAALNPDKEAVSGANADQLEVVIKTYNGDGSQMQNVTQPLVIGIGSGGNRRR